jgi:hypothetical protein
LSVTLQLADIKIKNSNDTSIFPKNSEKFAFVSAVKNVEASFLNALADKVEETNKTYTRGNGKVYEKISPIDAGAFDNLIRETFHSKNSSGITFKEAFKSVSCMVGSDETARELAISIRGDAQVNFNRALAESTEKMKNQSQQNNR